MVDWSGFRRTSNSTARVLLIAACVGLLTLSVATPLAHSISDHDQSTTVTAQSLQSPSHGGAANNSTDLPPGTSESGIDNVTRLTEAHRAVLNDSLYEAQMEWDQVSVASCQGSSGVEVVPISMTITSDVNRSYTRLVSEGVENEYWVTENATAVNTSVDSRARISMYQYHNIPQPWEDAMSETLHDWLNTSTYDFTGTVTRNNRTVYEFWSSGLRGNTTQIENTHARVLIDQEGVIHDAIGTRTYRCGNETVTARLNYSIQRPGTAPPTQPEWVTAELPHLEGSVIENGTVIALEHTGGTSISNATMKTFISDRTQTDTEIDDFDPGETLYLYRLQSAPDQLQVSKNETPTANESFVSVGEESVLVSVFNRPTPGPGDNRSLLIEVEPRDN